MARLREAIKGAEDKVRAKDEAIRNTEKRIQSGREEIARVAEQVNSHLVMIGLQKVQNSTDLNNSKYQSGVHIVMSQNGLFNDGKYEMDRDIKPLISEKKANWKIKIAELTQAKDKISQELVDFDIKLRNLEEEKKRLK